MRKLSVIITSIFLALSLCACAPTADISESSAPPEISEQPEISSAPEESEAPEIPEAPDTTREIKSGWLDLDDTEYLSDILDIVCGVCWLNDSVFAVALRKNNEQRFQVVLYDIYTGEDRLLWEHKRPGEKMNIWFDGEDICYPVGEREYTVKVPVDPGLEDKAHGTQGGLLYGCYDGEELSPNGKYTLEHKIKYDGQRPPYHKGFTLEFSVSGTPFSECSLSGKGEIYWLWSGDGESLHFLIDNRENGVKVCRFDLASGEITEHDFPSSFILGSGSCDVLMCVSHTGDFMIYLQDPASPTFCRYDYSSGETTRLYDLGSSGRNLNWWWGASSLSSDENLLVCSCNYDSYDSNDKLQERILLVEIDP